MSESLEQGSMKCPVCEEYSWVPTNRFHTVTEGTKESRLIPILSCKADNCGTSVAVDPVDPDGKFILSNLSS